MALSDLSQPDLAKSGKNRKIETFLRDLRFEPEWRREANRAAAYYDGRQLSPETLDRMKELGLSPLVRNLIGPTVDVVLGMEAKNRRDWVVRADEDPEEELALALTKALRDAERQSEADEACSDAYASQIKTGVGWVEVQREIDPFKSPYRVKHIHRREMFWDWRSQERDLSDARYLVRRKWYDEDQLVAVFPEHEELITRAINGWADWDFATTMGDSLDLAQRYDEATRTSLEAHEWADGERRRLLLYEVWYRVWERGQVLRLPDGRVVEFDRNNPQHALAVGQGWITPEPTLLTRIRMAWWLGPHPLYDIASPYPHNQFPYIPFWGYREDDSGIPYGLVRRMMSPQDEVNARLSKMMWLLSAKRVVMDEDAVEGTMSIQRVAQEAARPDAMFVLNQNRRNPNGFEVVPDREMSVQQFNVMKDASEAIQDTAGVYQALLGKDSTADSGVAIANLVEQGSTTLAEIADNFRYAKERVGELLLSLVRQELGQEQRTLHVEREGQQVEVVLNAEMTGPDGLPYRSNDVMRARALVVLEEVPQSPTYRNLVLTQLTELTKSLPPELQAVIMDIVVLATDIPQKKELADRIRRATGQGQATPEEAQAQAQQQALEQEAVRLELEAQQAKIAESQARVEKMMAEVQRILAETQNTRQEGDLRVSEHVEELADRAQGRHIAEREMKVKEKPPAPKAAGKASSTAAKAK